MANELLQGLLSNLLTPVDPREAQRAEGARLVSMMGTPGAAATYYAPQRAADFTKGLGQLFGMDQRSPQELLQEKLKGADIATPQGQAAMLKMVEQIDPSKALLLKMAFQEQNQQQAAVDQTTKIQNAALAGQVADDTFRAAQQVEQAAQNLRTSNLNILQENRLASQAATDAIEASNKAAANVETARNNLEDQKLRRLSIENQTAALNQAQDQLTATSQKAILSASAAGRIADGTARGFTSLANDYENSPPTSGFFGSTEKSFRDFMGTQGGEEILRTRYSNLMTSGAMANLPPGAASDADVALALEGWPNSYTNADTLAQFMRGQAKLSAYAAAAEQARANYIADPANRGTDAGFDAKWLAETTGSNEAAFKKKLGERYGLDMNDSALIGTDADFAATVGANKQAAPTTPTPRATPMRGAD